MKGQYEMSLLRIGHSADESLDSFYEALPDEGFMLELIRKLEQRLQSRRVFCLTSHRDLALLSKPDHHSVWWVKIRPLAPVPAVILEGVGPKRYMPWPSARVIDESESVDDAVEKVLKLMEYSEGWSEEQDKPI